MNPMYGYQQIIRSKKINKLLLNKAFSTHSDTYSNPDKGAREEDAKRDVNKG